MKNDNVEKMTSVAVMLLRDSKIALSFRLKTKTFPFVWAFPGGSIEEGESEVYAASREVFEETGLSIPINRFKKTENCFDGGQKCAIYKVELIADEILQHTEKDKHTNWYWFELRDVLSVTTLPGIPSVIMNQIFERDNYKSLVAV